MTDELFSEYDWERMEADAHAKCASCGSIVRIPEGVVVPLCPLCGFPIHEPSRLEDWA